MASERETRNRYNPFSYNSYIYLYYPILPFYSLIPLSVYLLFYLFLLKKKYDSTRVCRGTGGEEQGRNRTSWRGTGKIRAASFPPGFFQDFHVFECLFSVYFCCSAVPLFPSTLYFSSSLTAFCCVFLLWPVLLLISFSFPSPPAAGFHAILFFFSRCGCPHSFSLHPSGGFYRS